jgi:hypothetical protein
MVFEQNQVGELKRYYSNLQVVEEGGQKFIFFPNLKMPLGCNPQTVEGLLCPTPRDGYPSRLFLSTKVTHSGPGQNWNASGVMIVGKQWWAVSWKTNNNDQRLLGMLTAHLLAFQCKQS